jgi:type IV secretory pathway VirB6-like protein
MNKREGWRKWSWHNSKYYPCIRPYDFRKTIHISPRAHVAKLLSMQPRHCVLQRQNTFQFAPKLYSADKTMLVINICTKFNQIRSIATSINVVRLTYGDVFWNVERHIKTRWRQRNNLEDSMWRIFVATVHSFIHIWMNVDFYNFTV